MQSEGPDIDIDAIAALIEPHVFSADGALIKKFDTGQSNPTYLIKTREEKLVLRIKPAGNLLESAHNVGREFRVMQALRLTGVPVPKMIAFVGEEKSPINRDCFLMEYVAGKVFHDPSLPSLGRAEREKVFEGMNDTLVKLNGVAPGEIGLADFGRSGNYFERQTRVWTRQYQMSRSRPNSDMDFLVEWLVQEMPDDDSDMSLVHGDFRLDNLIFDGKTFEVVAVVDWEISTLGHPFADISYQCMQWRMPYKGGLRGLGGLDHKALGIPVENTYLRRFCDQASIPFPVSANWNFYLVFGCFRLAAILEGVARRALDGNASNPKMASEYGKCVPTLARMAVELTKKRAV